MMKMEHMPNPNEMKKMMMKKMMGDKKKVRYDEKMHEMYGTYGRTC